MPPLDDELRAALSSRASTLAPLADPFPGVARRARTLRRRRAATAVAGSALAVLGLVGGAALALPGGTLVSQGETATAPTPQALEPTPAPVPSTAPTTPPDATAAPISDYQLDRDDPWAYRSLGAPLPESEREAYARAWSDSHPDESRTPAVLFSQVYESSGLTEVVVLGSSSWGLLRESEAGPDLVAEYPLPQGVVLALVAVLPGDEAARLLVVADPEVEGMVHRVDPVGPVDSGMSELAPGVGTVALDTPPDPAADSVVAYVDEQEVWGVEVPDEVAGPPTGEGDEFPGGVPGNVLDWPVRGAAVEPDLLRQAQELLAQDRGGAAPEEVQAKVLFAGDDDAGNRYLFGQFWLPGEGEAATLGVVDAPQGGTDELQFRAPLTAGADIAVFSVSPAPGQSTTTLVVVPRPGTGQVEYAGDRASEWRPVGTGQEGQDGVVLLERAPQADRGEAVDRIRLFDGDGLEPFFEADVPSLLCGVTSCS